MKAVGGGCALYCGRWNDLLSNATTITPKGLPQKENKRRGRGRRSHACVRRHSSAHKGTLAEGGMEAGGRWPQGKGRGRGRDRGRGREAGRRRHLHAQTTPLDSKPKCHLRKEEHHRTKPRRHETTSPPQEGLIKAMYSIEIDISSQLISTE